MTVDELNGRLSKERIVRITSRQWSELSDHFEEVERHETFVAGDLLVVRGDMGLAAVEWPTPHECAVRRLSSAEEAGRFVRKRLDQYERMWDGCGCKIDYYKD